MLYFLFEILFLHEFYHMKPHDIIVVVIVIIIITTIKIKK